MTREDAPALASLVSFGLPLLLVLWYGPQWVADFVFDYPLLSWGYVFGSHWVTLAVFHWRLTYRWVRVKRVPPTWVRAYELDLPIEAQRTRRHTSPLLF